MLAVALLGAAPAAHATSHSFPMPGPPSSLALSADGATLFVGLDQHFARGGGVAAYRRDGEHLIELGRTAIPGGVQSIALTPDGSTILATTRVGLAWMAVAPLIAGKPAPAATLRTGQAPATNQLVVSRDGRYAFFTNTALATVGVARVGTDGLTIAATVNVDRAPAGLALSRDGATLYVVSEVASGPAQVPGASDPRLGRARCASNLGPEGTLSAIDTAKAVADPAHAVIARIAAGCSPARVALSSDGAVAWVTARGDNRILALDTAKMRSAPAVAVLATVDVGDLPVGLALASDGKRLLVADSNRSHDADVARDAELSLVDPGAALAGRPARVATIPSGALPREVIATTDDAFWVTNYLAKAVQLIALLKPTDRRNS